MQSRSGVSLFVLRRCWDLFSSFLEADLHDTELLGLSSSPQFDYRVSCFDHCHYLAILLLNEQSMLA